MLVKSKVTVGLILTDEKELIGHIIFLENWKYHQVALWKRKCRVSVCFSGGSFMATNNPSGFNCFYLNKNN